ncbi:MAG: hypothetical protein EH225_03205 [Calditrichaeota bacterium]|nr:hypothetical protein [Calditrichota bacterium]RQV93545.1 MAG: hypothetical protein EH221_09360 [bacterium]RQW06478.1 MAG: hypothetical protein EH225_03205 [Calditrichota bacterium]
MVPDDREKLNQVMEELRKLEREDKVLLGLYLYEGLSSDQVTRVLSMNQHHSPRKKEQKKSVLKNQFKRI